MSYILIILKIIPCLFLPMASRLVGWLVAIAVQFFITCVADDAFHAFIAQGEGDVVKVAHRMHVAVALLDRFVNLVLDKHVQVLDLFAC